MFKKIIFVILILTFIEFSLFAQAQRGIKLAYPVGTKYPHAFSGEVLYVGETVEIKWTTSGLPGGKVLIYYRTDKNSSWNFIACVDNNGHYQWKVPDAMTNTAQIRVERRQQCNFPLLSFSESDFFIISPLKILGSTLSMIPAEIQDGENIASLDFYVQNLTNRSIPNVVVGIIEPSTEICTGQVLLDVLMSFNPGLNHYTLNRALQFQKPTGDNKGICVELHLWKVPGSLDYSYRALLEVRPGVYKLAPWREKK